MPIDKEVVRSLCKATIVEVLDGNGWYYNCCLKCAKTVCPNQGGNFHCNNCNQPVDPIAQRYRTVIRIEDESGTTTPTLFNKEAEQLVGVPLTKIMADRE